jgi:serine kinase of HPr protein (carbohydrate metabolism regulator)
MTVKQIVETLNLNVFSLTDEEREVTGAYIGDLLSWVMGRAKSGDAWITIMSNVNIAAVAALADTACIILAEGVTLDESVIEVAKSKDINILGSEEPAYEIAVKLSQLM